MYITPYRYGGLKVDKVLFLIVFAIVTTFLFVAHKRQWWSKATFEALVVAATVGAAIAAIFVFIIPAAQPLPQPPMQANKNEPYIQSLPGNSNTNQQSNSQAQKPETSTKNTNLSSLGGVSGRLVGESAGPGQDFVYVKKGETIPPLGPDSELFISVRDVTINDMVSGTIGAPGFPNVDFSLERVGFLIPFQAKRKYEIRIMEIDYAHSKVKFHVTRIK